MENEYLGLLTACFVTQPSGRFLLIMGPHGEQDQFREGLPEDLSEAAKRFAPIAVPAGNATESIRFLEPEPWGDAVIVKFIVRYKRTV